ncbi:DUF4250 domain-containing protein [Clostridium chauvoei]|uniref:DUF4250 domain-containing protein n=2 Tax=Clostridium chauvoei TaxID=46867 RepID=S6EPI4_9CLOT|nr:DUF4250 domain-containing protein [Clostridium chauvoei]ATD54566.1 DUF4250 domain-containing protein [Clostridium chauvoei]ATD57753.1 DUF4250 domain-containing protein [Clostridium chauvoei]MBX7281534.1 DUF4250 domain-containing protein [Clostridium chauvoei]MBX7284054.1 DUF4250 domain-containing protein [Clostridium chauvoei]MBX7286582.1 DUF4250 domain-containing protein [Clostridium chauvoei]
MDRESILSMDPNILVSLVNMKLRDFYSSLESFCEDIGIEVKELKDKLSSVGYNYEKEQNQFK